MKWRRLSQSVRKRLEKRYGRPSNNAPEDPIAVLVNAILSQNTTDITSDRAFTSLRSRFKTWEALRDADQSELADVIRVGGLPQIKAERIINALNEIQRITGHLSLDFLKGLSEAEADEWLGQLKGVGPKTRAIVILFALDKKAFPVDTHILRVAKRLGLVRAKASREEAQNTMAKLSDPEDYFSYHINLIEHGREICKALRPKCGECGLSDLCEWPEKKKYGRTALKKATTK